MSPAEQQRRRALKRERRTLDRSAQAIAAAGRHATQNLPSTRAKQARWHHDVSAAAHQRAASYEHLRRRLREIAAQLARNEPDADPPCECRCSGDTADASGCPAHGASR